MGIKWDDPQRYALLLMIVAQQKDPFKGVDYQALTEKWMMPGDCLTVRAAQEQVKIFRKALKDIDAGDPPSTTTPYSSVTSTPRRSKAPATPSSKRRGAAVQASSAKKRRVTTVSSEESAEMTGNDTSTPAHDTDDGQAPQRRTMPARASTLIEKHVTPNDSDGADDPTGNEETGSDYDLASSESAAKRAKARMALLRTDDREKTVKPEIEDMAGVTSRVTSFETAPEEM